MKLKIALLNKVCFVFKPLLKLLSLTWIAFGCRIFKMLSTRILILFFLIFSTLLGTIAPCGESVRTNKLTDISILDSSKLNNAYPNPDNQNEKVNCHLCSFCHYDFIPIENLYLFSKNIINNHSSFYIYNINIYHAPPLYRPPIV